MAQVSRITSIYPNLLFYLQKRQGPLGLLTSKNVIMDVHFNFECFITQYQVFLLPRFLCESALYFYNIKMFMMLGNKHASQ